MFLLALAFGTSAFAQTDTTSASTPKYVIRVGPTLGLVSGGVALDNAEGRKVNPDFWFLQNYGVMVFAPFSKGSSMGARLDLGISTVGTRTRPYEFFDSKTDWKGYTIERYTYFTVAPQVSLYGVLIGMGINIPMKGEMWHPERSDETFIVEKSTLKTAIDVRLGGSINVWDSKVGILTVELLAKYFVTGLYQDDTYTNGFEVNNIGVPVSSSSMVGAIDLTPVSLQLGLSYQFKIGQ
ncbi:MAG: hypothetical protein H7X70_02970 [Candidatus Kapabacteria bacterium]|nr:hypothetical protein [Candidatus Kapabacteria bacterium]